MRQLRERCPSDLGRDALMTQYDVIPRLVQQADLKQPASVLEILESFRELPLTRLVQGKWPGGAAQAKSELTRWNQFTTQQASPCFEAWRALRYELALRVLHGARTVAPCMIVSAASWV